MMRGLLYFLALCTAVAGSPGEVAFISNTVLYREDAGTVNATLVVYGPLTDESTIRFSIVETSPTVRAGEDFIPAMIEDLIVSPTNSNVTEFNVSLTIIDDDILETFEVFELTATLVGNENQSASLTVIIQDFGDSITVDFEEEDEHVTALETATNLKVCLTIVNGSTEGDVEITVATVPTNDGNPASSVSDFVPTSDVLLFNENVTRACGYIPIFNDTIVEGEESFGISVSRRAGIELVRPNITGIIEDANGAAVVFYNPVLGKPSSTFSIEEKNVNTSLEICLQLLLPGPEPTERLVQAFLTTPESYPNETEPGMKFRSAGNIIPVTNRELSFAVGSTNGSIICTEIGVIGDLEPEPTTFFVVVVRAGNEDDIIADTNVARVIVTDDDAAALQCPGLMDPPNGHVTLASTLVGSEAEYGCLSGYVLSGDDAVRVCEATGVWSGSPPTCTLIECAALPAPVQGEVDTTAVGDGGRLVVGSEARFSCQKGFRLVGDSIRTCEDTGNWTGANPSCVEILVPPATVSLDTGPGVDTTLAIAISSSVGGILIFLIIIAIIAYLIRRRYKYSQKYYCSKVDIRVKKKETYTTSTTIANSRHGAIGLHGLRGGVGIAEESDRSSNGSSYSSSGSEREQRQCGHAMVIENSFTNTNSHHGSEVQVHVEHVLSTSTPPKDGTHDSVLIENAHIAATPEPESQDNTPPASPATTPPITTSTTTTITTTTTTTTTSSGQKLVVVEMQEASSTSDEAITPKTPPVDHGRISKTSSTESNSIKTDSFISDPIDLTVVSVSVGEKSSMEDCLDEEDSQHTSTDLNSNLNNNVTTKVSVLIENPNTGATEIYTEDESSSDTSLRGGTQAEEAKRPTTAVSQRKTSTVMDASGSRRSLKSSSDRKVIFV